MNKPLEKSKVYRTDSFTTTVNLFEYGQGYRVKMTKTSNDVNYSRLIEHRDDFTSYRDNALQLYKKFCEEAALPFRAENEKYLIYMVAGEYTIWNKVRGQEVFKSMLKEGCSVSTEAEAIQFLVDTTARIVGENIVWVYAALRKEFNRDFEKCKSCFVGLEKTNAAEYDLTSADGLRYYARIEGVVKITFKYVEGKIYWWANGE